MVILGLDISTTTVGYCYTSDDSTIVAAGHIRLDKEKDIYKKADLVIETLRAFPVPDKIAVEEAMGNFASGFTSRQTMNLLVLFNAMIRYCLYKETGLGAIEVNPLSARKLILGRARVKGMTGKQLVASLLPGIVDLAPWTVGHKRDQDTYDAIVISLYAQRSPDLFDN